ncbi:MFS transporter [Pleionea litopenaei]|uniref:MFS transporter n=1 Tax=Pleionea litopenaei TaxID=3070815 RepID=A0AA51RQZ4_9GAMM|nr:MFS transporter [Pleionea sp. HL-JVS1]WMS85849.1 MFS transporter [Pleionea sp. HL-JVS1]
MAENQYQLLKQKRFFPFFITQALGAFNDNVYKNSLVTLFTYTAVSSAQNEGFLVNLAAIIFILPFFLFSATSGQFAEKYSKAKSIRNIKLLEIGIMLLACVGFYLQSVNFLLFVLFLMGLQSTLFGPIKYSIMPQYLKEKELVGANGLVEMSTFLAILLGLILGIALTNLEPYGRIAICSVVVLISLVGYWSSRQIPVLPAVEPTLKINWNPITETAKTFKYVKSNRTVMLSVLGISWFWFFGATILAQLPTFSKSTLGGDEYVYMLLMAAFSVGIGLGSLLCEKMSGRKVEIGLVPFGAIGMTLFSIDIYFTNHTTDALPILSATEFLQHWNNWHVLIDATLIGVFGGFFIVPLYALIQQRCPKNHVSRVIAGNNILNALFMVLSGITALILLSLNFSIPEIILITGILNAVVSIYIFTVVPEFLMRFLVWILINLLYRIRLTGLNKIPDEGAAVIVCNHVSFMDALIIAGCCRRPVRFVMDHRIFKTPILSFIFKTAKAIPIAPAKENPELMNKAFDQVAEYLEEGELVCIFPEGKITSTGEINTFKAGIEKIIARTPVPVIPMALSGLWGSFFSRKDGPAMGTIPKRFWSKIAVTIGQVVPSSEVSAAHLQQQVSQLRGERP